MTGTGNPSPGPVAGTRMSAAAGRLVAAAGFRDLAWHHIYAGIINAVTATI